MSEENFQDESLEAQNRQLDHYFQQYRSACPEVEPGANFMPLLWQKIDARRNLWFQFGRLGRNALALSAALCLLLLALNLAAPPEVAANYADTLLSDDSAEQVYYSESIRPAPLENREPDSHR